MARAHLVACSACARHVRVTEARCPFCDVARDESLRARLAPRGPSARLSRAALVAYGLNAIGVGACGARTALEAAGAGEHGGMDTADAALLVDAHAADSGVASDSAHGGGDTSMDGPHDAAVDGTDADDDVIEPFGDGGGAAQGVYGGPPVQGAEGVPQPVYGAPPAPTGRHRSPWRPR